jgi:predicted MFS family arabinose efflux permease
MQAYTPPDTKATRAEYGWRYIFTRMVPTAIIVFFILFTFFPDFGSPVSNLRRLGEGSGRLSSERQKQSALTVATGLQQLQASGQLGSYLQLKMQGQYQELRLQNRNWELRFQVL